eukprot:758141-Rhodomonas_salina.1
MLMNAFSPVSPLYKNEQIKQVRLRARIRIYLSLNPKCFNLDLNLQASTYSKLRILSPELEALSPKCWMWGGRRSKRSRRSIVKSCWTAARMTLLTSSGAFIYSCSPR